MRSHLTRLPKIRIQRRYIRTAAQAAGETVALLVFGFALGIAVITAACSGIRSATLSASSGTGCTRRW
jgi:hypothetical protein